MRPGDLVTRWNLILAVGVTLCSAITGFLMRPPLGPGDVQWAKFSVFITALIVGLWLVPLYLYSRREKIKFWTCIAILFVAGSLSSFFFYYSLFDSWTFEYFPGQQRVVTASKLSRQSQVTHDERIKKGDSATNYDLLRDRGGVIVEVWPDTEERTRRTKMLLALYIGTLLISASAIITVGEAFYCATLKK